MTDKTLEQEAEEWALSVWPFPCENQRVAQDAYYDALQSQKKVLEEKDREIAELKEQIRTMIKAAQTFAEIKD